MQIGVFFWYCTFLPSALPAHTHFSSSVLHETKWVEFYKQLKYMQGIYVLYNI